MKFCFYYWFIQYLCYVCTVCMYSMYVQYVCMYVCVYVCVVKADYQHQGESLLLRRSSLPTYFAPDLRGDGSLVIEPTNIHAYMLTYIHTYIHTVSKYDSIICHVMHSCLIEHSKNYQLKENKNH